MHSLSCLLSLGYIRHFVNEKLTQKNMKTMSALSFSFYFTKFDQFFNLLGLIASENTDQLVSV